MTAAERQSEVACSVEVDLANHMEFVLASAGLLVPERVRRIRIRGEVDSRVARLVIPDSVARQLGLECSSIAQVRYADGHTADRAIAKLVHLMYGGRDGVFSAIVEPDRQSTLIGAIVLEDLDLLVDRAVQRLVPRDPKQIISEIE